MLSAGGWRKSQPNTVLFVIIDASGNEVTGDVFDVWLSKAGAAFSLGSGSSGEIGDGWYSYTSTSDEADTSGPVALMVVPTTGIQQNLEYVVEDRVVTAIQFTYSVTSTAGNVPLAGVKVSIYANPAATNLVWAGVTDSFGVARDHFGNKPRLQPGTYYFIRDRAGYAFDNPDMETVS
jgi:hypothetical protein